MPWKGLSDMTPDLPASSGHGLASLVYGEAEADPVWGEDELEAILRHQLTVPVQLDLSALRAARQEKVRAVLEASGLVLKSFGDVFSHPNPPLEVLQMIKDYAKAARASPVSHLPRDIATVLYYLTIAAARVRCGRRISSLSDELLGEGLKWCLARKWLDDRTRDLLEEARAQLRG